MLKLMLTVYETTIHLNIKKKKGHAKNKTEKNDSRRVLVWNRYFDKANLFLHGNRYFLPIDY